jgi:hypothetical protein
VETIGLIARRYKVTGDEQRAIVAQRNYADFVKSADRLPETVEIVRVGAFEEASGPMRLASVAMILDGEHPVPRWAIDCMGVVIRVTARTAHTASTRGMPPDNELGSALTACPRIV